MKMGVLLIVKEKKSQSRVQRNDKCSFSRALFPISVCFFLIFFTPCPGPPLSATAMRHALVVVVGNDGFRRVEAVDLQWQEFILNSDAKEGHRHETGAFIRTAV